MIKHLILFSLAGTLFIMVSCQRGNDKGSNIEYIYHETSVESIDSVHTVNKLFSFYCTVIVPDSGPWWYHDLNVNKTGFELTIVPIIKREKPGIYLPVIGHMEVVLPIGVDTLGTYTFHFWRGDSTTLDTTLTIP